MSAKCWHPQGLAMWDFWNGKMDSKLTIHSNEGRWEVPVSIYFRNLDQFPELEQYAISLCQGKILDVGSGSGCHARVLADLGMDVTALDINPLSVKLMKEQGLAQVIEGDICRMVPGKFDTVLMLMNGIGMVNDLKGLTRFLLHACSMVSPGGQLVFDSTDLAVENPALSQIKGRYYGITHYRLEYKNHKGHPFRWLYVDPALLIELAGETGWHCQIVYNDKDGHYLAKLRRMENGR